MNNYVNEKKFLVANWMTAHEQSLMRGKTLDGHMKKFLMGLEESGHLNQSLVFVLADHGAHSDQLLDMLEGNLEHRNPALFVVAPAWVCKTLPEICHSLSDNQNKLLTAYDLYTTWKHVAVYPHNPSRPFDAATSLFERIPANRTCNAAKIPADYCGCVTKV